MPYFLILPVFALAMCAEGLGVLLCAAVPSIRPAALPYGRSLLLGSSLGFLMANLASVLLAIVPVLIGMLLGVGTEGHGAQIVATFVLLGLFVGPLVASPLGFLGGAILGLRRTWRRRHAAGAPV